jgi:hypothetical protein
MFSPLLKHSRILILLLVTVIVVMGTNACTKYEEGPLISLNSRKSRVVNDWKLTFLSRNNYDETADYEVYRMKFEENGKFEWTYRPAGQMADSVFTADWELASVNEQIKLSYPAPPGTGVDTLLLYFDIVRLKDKELWLRYRVDGDEYYIQLIPN